MAEAEAGRLRPFLSGSWAGVNCGEGGRGGGWGARHTRLLTSSEIIIAVGGGVIVGALQREGAVRRNKRLVVMDMDSTLIINEVIDEIARIQGVFDEVSVVSRPFPS